MNDQPRDARARIRERAIAALRDLPGALALYEFGSGVSGDIDRWSDIDLQVVTTSLADAFARRAWTYADIGPVWLEWTIVHNDEAWAATVLFDGVSPVAHLDLGLVASGCDAMASLLAGAVERWRQPPSTAEGLVRNPVAYSPAIGTLDHTVIGDLISILRYAKARHRGHRLLCWKFYAALANRVLEAEFLARVDPERGFHKSLTSHEHALLRKTMPDADQDSLVHYLMCATSTSMDAAMLALGQRLLRTTAPFAVDDSGMITAGIRLLNTSANALGGTSPENATTVPAR